MTFELASLILAFVSCGYFAAITVESVLDETWQDDVLEDEWS